MNANGLIENKIKQKIRALTSFYRKNANFN